MASVVEAPAILVYDRSRKVADDKAVKKFLKTPDPYAYTYHPFAVTKAVTIAMEYDKDAHAFVTYVEELHRVSSFGESESIALDNTAEMIRGYIKSIEVPNPGGFSILPSRLSPRRAATKACTSCRKLAR